MIINITTASAATPKIRGFVRDEQGVGIGDVWIKWTNKDGNWRFIKTDTNGWFTYYGWGEYWEMANEYICSVPQFNNESDCEANGHVWFGSKCSDGSSLTENSCRNNGGYWQHFRCSDGQSISESECTNNGGYWYENFNPNVFGVADDCDASIFDKNRHSIVVKNLESMISIDVNFDGILDSQKNYATCPAGQSCPNNLPQSAPTNCDGWNDPGAFQWNPGAGFGCRDIDETNLTPNRLEAFLHHDWSGYFEPVPSSAEADVGIDGDDILFGFPNNVPDLIDIGGFIYHPQDASPTPTDSPTPSNTPTLTPTNTPTHTPTNTPTNTPTSTVTPTGTSTPTNTPTNTPTSSVTPTNTPTSTPTNTPTTSVTPTNTPTSSPTPTGSITPTNTPTSTPTGSLTPTNTPTTTLTPTNTPTGSITPTNTPTLTPTVSVTVTPSHSLTPTPTIIQDHESSCDNAKIINGPDFEVEDIVTFKIQGTDSEGDIKKYKVDFGDGNITELNTPMISHKYGSKGTYTAQAYILDSRDQWITSDNCQVRNIIIGDPGDDDDDDEEISDCDEIKVKFTEKENYIQAKITIYGYDERGDVEAYKAVYSDTLENGLNEYVNNVDNVIYRNYYKPGKYWIKGYIRDTEDKWKGGIWGCRKDFTLDTIPQAQAQALAELPETGGSTMFNILGISSAILGILCASYNKIKQTVKLRPHLQLLN